MRLMTIGLSAACALGLCQAANAQQIDRDKPPLVRSIDVSAAGTILYEADSDSLPPICDLIARDWLGNGADELGKSWRVASEMADSSTLKPFLDRLTPDALRHIRGNMNGPPTSALAAIDLSNNGSEYYWHSTIQGTAHCEHNNFYRADANGHIHPVSDGVLVSAFNEDGGRCGGARELHVVEESGTVYFLDIDGYKAATDLLKFDGTRLRRVCTATKTEGEIEVVEQCDHAICGRLVQEVESFVHGMTDSIFFKRTERPVPRTDLELPQNADARIREGSWYFADLDDDGVDEIIVKLAFGSGDNFQNLYVFGQLGGEWHLVGDLLAWPFNFGHLPVAVENVNGLNFLVRYGYDEQIRMYKLSAFQYSNWEVREVGHVTIRRRPHIVVRP